MSATPNDCGVYCDFETVTYQVDGAVARLTSCRHREVGGVQLPPVMFSPLAAFDPVFRPPVISRFTLQPTELTVEQRPVGRD